MDSQAKDSAITSKTYLVDNTGYQAQINWESVGGDEKYPCCVMHTMEPNLPLTFWFDSRGHSEEITTVSVIFLANGHKNVLQNLRLQRR